MRTRLVLLLGTLLFNAIAAACEDDPTDLDYLKDAATAEVASGAGGASAGTSGASAGTSGASGASAGTSGASAGTSGASAGTSGASAG
ncbi:MAG TPA: hypothetical protein VGI70_12550, partial [Polyangiales bacterium]